jgi:hypothetical protein
MFVILLIISHGVMMYVILYGALLGVGVVQAEPCRGNENKKTGHFYIRYNITHKIVPPYSLRPL